MGVACGSVQLSDKSKTFINSVLGRQIRRPDMEAFLRIPSAENRSIASLRADCTQVLLTDAKPHLADLPPPYHELGPTMKLVLGMWLLVKNAEHFFHSTLEPKHQRCSASLSQSQRSFTFVNSISTLLNKGGTHANVLMLLRTSVL